MRGELILSAVLAVAGCGPKMAGGTPEPAPAGAGAETGPAPTTKGSGPAVTYHAQPARQVAYHRVDSVSFQLPGGGSQVQTFGRTAFLTVALTPAASGFQAAISLDSIRADSGQVMPLPIDSLKAAEGTRWTADVSPTGELSNLVASDSTTVAAQLSGSLQQLFPVLPAGGARTGAEWSDTTSVSITAGTVTTHQTAATNYRATGFVQQGSQRALEIEARADTKQEGSGTQFGQAIQLSGTGTSHTTYHLSQDGTLIHAVGGDQSEVTLTVPAVGQTVPVSQSSTYTISASVPSH